MTPDHFTRAASATLQNPSADIGAAAEPLLQAMRKASYAGGGAQAFQENFEDFSFASQQVAVIYLDNKDDTVRFSSKNSDIIRFVPISGNDPKTHIRPNHAFFNRRAVSIAPSIEIVAYGSAPASIDSWAREFSGCLSGRVQCFIFDRGESAEAALAKPPVVGPFDPGHDRDAQFLAAALLRERFACRRRGFLG